MRGEEPGDVRATAEELFEFMSDEQHEGMWEALREAGMAMLLEMGNPGTPCELRGAEV